MNKLPFMYSGTPNLTGKLLLAHPNLRDPNFRRSIIFLTSHDPENGALGFIINRPTDKTFSPPDTENVSAKLHLGGPVAMDSLIITRLNWDESLHKTTIHPISDVEGDHEFLFAQPGEVIAILGYSGWSAGQLENELAQNTWIVIEANMDLANSDAATWKALVSKISPELHLLASQPDDPSLN